MEREEAKYLVTAFADNEIKDQYRLNEIEGLLQSDEDLKFEYDVQVLIKNLVNEKVQFRRTPEKLRNKIIRKIKPAALQNNIKSRFFQKPALLYGSIAVFVTAVLLLIFNRPSGVEDFDFASEQKGRDNMFVQAENNFHNILDGILKPQLISDSPEEIHDFFEKQGVSYSTVIPVFEKWNLLGAVVSEVNGEKFAHHVYTAKDGRIIYLYQVDESYIKNNRIIKLTDDLINYLDAGNCYISRKNKEAFLLTKASHNIIAVAANINSKELLENFCLLE